MSKICGQGGGSASSSGAGGNRNNPPLEGIVREAEKRVPIVEVERDQEDDDDDDEPLVNKKARVDTARREKARVEEPEMVGEVSEEAKKKRVAALASAELGTKKRKEREEKKKRNDVEIIEEAEKGDGRGSGSSTPASKKPRTGGSLVIRGSASAMSKKEGKKVQTGERRSHRFKFDYQGETPIMMDPEICGRFLQQIPEALDEYASGKVDLNTTYDEFAGLIFQLVNMKNRSVRGHENVVMDLKKEVSEREGEIAKLKEENDALKTLERDVEEERKRRISKEEELMAQVVEVGAREAEIGRLNLKLRLRSEEKEAANLELEKREKEIERLRRESLTVEDLRKKVAGLEATLASRDEEITIVDRGCRVVLKRLLREQADALYAGYLAKNEHLCDRLDRYLTEREKREEVESKLDQAVGTIDVLKALKKEKIVEVPDSTLLELKKKKKEYKEELEKLVVREFSSENLRLGLPDSVGAVDVDGIEFKTALMVTNDDAVSEGRVERGEEMGSQLAEKRSTSKDEDFIDVEN